MAWERKRKIMKKNNAEGGYLLDGCPRVQTSDCGHSEETKT